LLVIIGNIEKLVKEFEKSSKLKHVIKLSAALDELKQRKSIEIINVK
jgi:hypothetical protein